MPLLFLMTHSTKSPLEFRLSKGTIKHDRSLLHAAMDGVFELLDLLMSLTSLREKENFFFISF